jgi:hypothetical protein
MPNKYARAIPQLEAFKMLLALWKQRVSLCDRLFFRDAGEFLNGLNVTVAHEIALHGCNSEFAVSLNWNARLLSLSTLGV